MYDDGLQGLTPVRPRKPAGIMPNAQNQTFHGFMTGAPYELAIIEFDDQGRCYDRGQMDGVTQRLEALAPDGAAAGEDVILVVFVHGWQHDARSDDDNLTAFRALLSRTVKYETDHVSPGVAPRPVLGVFVGWRGLSDFGLGNVVADATFWTRQAAGRRVAVGSVRELFGRLRHYRNRQQQKRGGNPLFGDRRPQLRRHDRLFRSRAIADSSSVSTGWDNDAGIRRPRAARESGDRGRALHPDLRSCHQRGLCRPHDQATSGLHLRAGGERPTVGTVFPLGNALHAIDEATIGDLEKWCVTHAFGFVPGFRTHKLAGPTADQPFALDPPGTTQTNPFWMIGAEKR